MNNNRDLAVAACPAFGWSACCWLLWLWLGILVIPAQSQQLPQTNGDVLKLRPQFVSAADLSKALFLAIGNQGSLAVLDSQDLVLVAGPPEILQRAVQMMEQVDSPRWQVRLAVYLYEVELNELKQLELAAVASSKLRSDSVRNETNQFHVLSSHMDLNQTLRLLGECPGAKLLADPQLTVVDRQTAAFSLVTRIPNGASGFEDVGVKLSITPRISSSSSVELHIAPQYSSITGFNNQGNPVIDLRSAETTVRAAHFQTLVFGGLRKRNSLESMPTAAGLVNRKVVEPLFRAANAEPSESELICIVRPEILGNSKAPDPLAVAPPRPESALAVQNGAYQEPLINAALEQVKPSAYRPSVYSKPSAAQTIPRKNINTSRNSVTQPLPLPSRQK